jgi:MFS family permease
VLRESRDPDPGAVPDVAGAVLLAGAVGLLALGLVEGQQWGWGSPRIVGSLAASAALAPLVVVRSLRHRSPVIELSLFRVRSFAVANVGTILFASAFYAMLLANVLFLTSVWGYSILTAGLALTPGPLMAAAFAGPAGRLADRIGQRAIVVPGAAVYAAGIAWFVTRVGTHPDFAGQWLPGTLLTGAGVGLAFPTLGSAAAASLPPARFGVGSAITATSRQVGAVLGVAVLVAILGTPAPAQAPAAFDHAWTAIALAGAAAGVAALALGPKPGYAPAPAGAKAAA